MNALPLKSGEIYRTSTPATFGPHTYGALSNSGAAGPITIHGTTPSGPDNFLRLQDGSSDLLFDGLEVTALWRFWITGAKRLTLRNGHSHHMRMEGMILGACEDVLIEDWVSEYCGPQFMNGYSDSSHHEPSADHAFYPQNYGGKRTTMRRCIGQHGSGCGLHLYGNGDTGDYGEAFVGEDLAFLYCGSEGTPCIQPDGTRASSLKNVLVAHSSIGGFTWGNGDEMPCKDWTITGLTMWNPDAKFNIHIAPGTSGIVYRDSVFVLADAPLCEGTEGGDFEWPRFENCWFFTNGKAIAGPSDAYSGCAWRSLPSAASLFPRALQGDFTPADPAVPGFRDWRTGPINPPPPPPPPNPSPTPDLPTARAALQDAAAALGKAEQGNNKIASLIQGVARRALKKSLAETNAGEALNLRDAKSAVARAGRAVGE